MDDLITPIIGILMRCTNWVSLEENGFANKERQNITK